MSRRVRVNLVRWWCRIVGHDLCNVCVRHCKRCGFW